MTSLMAAVGITALLWAAIFAAFVVVRARWAARFEHGFFIQLLAALVGLGLMSASIVGVWGYLAAKQILDDELIVEMRDVGAIVESGVLSEIGDIQTQLTGLGASFADARDRGAPPAELRDRLTAAPSFDTQFLQLRAVDSTGATIAEAGNGGLEPSDKIAIAFGLKTSRSSRRRTTPTSSSGRC